MIELIRRGGDSVAIVTDEASSTYAELTATAERIAAGLADRGITRFGIVDFDAHVVVALLAAASLIGAEACIYPPAEPAEIADLASRFDHQVLVSDRTDLVGIAEIVPPASVAASAPRDLGQPPAHRPHLVLTTGTTGAPRGVRHDWVRVLRSASRIAPAPDERWLLAYGAHQFAGLQILVHVFAAGATLVAPAPRRPREGLAAMRAHAVDHASATPTYWRFLMAELRSDGGAVPALRQITLGGEAVPASLLEELTRTFPEANVSQIYAASEIGATGSVRDGRNGLPLSVLDRGEDADVQLKIVDGELWARSRIGMLGYYGEEPVEDDVWRPTGDVVEVAGDRIVFCGRTSEIINVGGVKVHPLPIEERVGSIAGVDVVRVFGRPSALTGAIVAVEVVAAPGVDTEQLEDAIRDACEDLVAAARPRSIRFVETIAMAGNKIVRSTGDG